MRVVALISGGKDSCYNMMQCVAAGHTIVALANLRPQQKDELDSYMYQTVGHHGIELYAEAMSLPLYRADITGAAVDQGRCYAPTDSDEVEDMYRLLAKVKEDLAVDAVSVGAILSDYQRIRVENVCSRLGLVSLSYLWRRNQKELLQEMITSGVEAIIIKVAALGLDPRAHLGLPLSAVQPHLQRMHDKYGLNVCGEGGEYETFTLDCPLFARRLVVDEKELVIHSDDPVAPVGYLNLKLHCEPKDTDLTFPPVKNSMDYVGDLNDSVFSDLSDNELSETELVTKDKIGKKELSELTPLLTYAGDKVEDDESIDKPDTTAVYEQPESECDIQPVEDHSSIFANSHGWCFVGGVVGEGADTARAARTALTKLINLMASEGLTLRDVCSVNVYMRDMGAYAQLNDVYSEHFDFVNPPTRVCVQCPLPADVGLIMDAVAHRPVASPDPEAGGSERVTMHVQSISHWAPANIGPYSQAVKIGETVATSGQIALVPGAMRLAAGGARPQSALALRHVSRVVRAAHRRADVRSVVQSVCYTTDIGAVAAARRQLERRTAGALAQYAVVGGLPRAAAVEWHAWAHSDNNRFEYEETGCSIGDYKVAITRRWNYENTVAAFVCCVATGSSPSTSQLSFASEEACAQHRAAAARATPAELRDVLLYALRRLHRDASPAAAAAQVRVFYQAWGGPAPARLLAAAAAARAEFPRAAVTAVPVRALHNAATFLSVSGLRLDE